MEDNTLNMLSRATVSAIPICLSSSRHGFHLPASHPTLRPGFPHPLKIYRLTILQTVLYPPVKAAGIQIERLERECEFNEYVAHEMCRGYAAMEDLYGGDLTYLLASFRLLSVAGFALPHKLRRWYWYKMAHFERLAPLYAEPVRKYVGFLWGIPEMLTMGFSDLLPQENRITPLTPEDIDAAATVVRVPGDSGASGDTDANENF